MALLDTINMESNDVTIEFPDGRSGAASIVTTPVLAGHGTYALERPNNTGFFLRNFTPTATMYMLFLWRVTVSTNPSAQAQWRVVVINTAAAAQIGMIRLDVESTGAMALRLVNQFSFAQLGSPFTVVEDTWYQIGIRLFVGGLGVGELELQVDGVQRAVGTGIDLGTTNVGQTNASSTASAPNGLVGSMFYDSFLIRDDFFPTYTVPALTMNVNDAMGVGDRRYTQV